MKIVKYEDAVHVSNSDRCKVVEYPLNDPDINCGVATISGRYPETGYCVNQECKELIYVVKGEGILQKKDSATIHFKERDTILIDKGEVYYWDAHCEIVMPCTPSWFEEQHKLIEEEKK